jgi:hypothetical protein
MTHHIGTNDVQERSVENGQRQRKDPKLRFLIGYGLGIVPDVIELVLADPDRVKPNRHTVRFSLNSKDTGSKSELIR